MEVTISSAVLAAILSHAAAEPGREVCGLLLGRGDRIASAVPVANVAADPARAFELDPAAQFTALRAARAGGPAVIGHYHSHPNGRAEPSPCDAAQARGDGALWLIVAGGAVTAWRATAAEAFEPILLSIRLADSCVNDDDSPQERP